MLNLEMVWLGVWIGELEGLERSLARASNFTKYSSFQVYGDLELFFQYQKQFG